MRILSAISYGTLLVVMGIVLILWVERAEEGDPSSSEEGAPEVTFTPSAGALGAYDFLEVTVGVKKPTAKNAFTDVTVTGQFQRENDPPVSVEGFCDSVDGSTYRVRYMPSKPGKYTYSVSFRQGDVTKTDAGKFEATDGKRRGVLRVDKDHPWHFLWEGTGEHYFFNGNTAFLLMGWQDEKVIRDALERQHRLKINRLRVLLAGGRSSSFWGEPIIPNQDFQAYLNPWIGEHAADPTHPGFDYARFNVAYWQKFERMLRHARGLDLIISVVLDWNDSRVHPRRRQR